MSYWRLAEFAYVWRRLKSFPRSARILDVGSPKDLATILARHRGFHVTAIDILDDAIAVSRRYTAAQGIEGDRSGQVSSEVRDGRTLPYGDCSFDAAYTVSVLEHIPDFGDLQAIHELTRVVKPGGLIVATVPYDLRYRETFVSGQVYDRRPHNTEALFYERHYDDRGLRERLIDSSGSELVDLEFWGEGPVRMEAILDRLGPLRFPVSPFEALLSCVFLNRIEGRRFRHPMAAFLTLRKPE